MMWMNAVNLPTVLHVLVALSFPSSPHLLVDAHGYLDTPRSRNVYAHEVGPTCSGSGCPPAEYCYHCLNINDGICGRFGSRSYESSSWLDKNGAPMPWLAQEEYVEGDTILVRSYLDTHHNGHMEIRACNKGPDCTQADFEGNELTFVQDTVLEGNHIPMPADENYPERGMYAGGQGGGIQWFEFVYQLPMGMYGDQVMLQWKYITANSCSPPGYVDYFGRFPDIPSSYWTVGLGECSTPYPNDGERGEEWPEQFFNCAEVKIVPANPGAPTISPMPTTPKPTEGPTKSSPPVAAPTCSAEWAECTYDWTSCCEGLMCTKVDPSGYRRCLVDKCSNDPSPPPVGSPDLTTSPTPALNPPPTLTITSSPSLSSFPTSIGGGCCTIDLKTCHHEPGTFCALSKENCEGPCGKLWLPDGELDGCLALWQPCSADAECCQHAICDPDRGSGGECHSDDPYLTSGSSPTTKPTQKPTDAPTLPSPTLSPTTPVPTAKPTQKPTNAPTLPSPTLSPTTPVPTTPPQTTPSVTQAPQGSGFPAYESSFVRVNQIGYLRFAKKIGIVVDSSTTPLAWQIQDSSSSVLLSGVTTVYGDDEASGDHVHHADFSSFTDIGSYKLVVDGIGGSLVFEIAPSLYPNLPHEAMNYFYFHRMGIDIAAEHLIDERYARAALHPGDSSVPPYSGWCETCTNFDLFGSWADAGDFGVYTVNHAISAWTLLNLHELFPEAFVDGDLNLPESGNSFPDVLDEVDFGSRFMRGMLPSDGGLASHKAHNHAWSVFTITIDGENALQSTRSAMGSSTPATYAVARVNAQLARMWQVNGGDEGYVTVLWNAAVDAWSRADGTNKSYSASEASPGPAIGGGDYPDGQVSDDRYAAACEMYLTALELGDTKMQTYKDVVVSSPFFTKIGQWDWATVTGAGTLSLYAVENDLSAEDKVSIETNIISFAEQIKLAIDSEGYPSNLNYPSEFGQYPWGSNSFMMNRAIALAYAYEITGDISYQEYILRTMDYIMGVNAMDISYVTGYGEKAETDTHDRWAWTVGEDTFWPKGWLSGGPNDELINDYETPGGVAAAKSYAGPGTAPHAWGSKENTINWNAPLAWVAWYIENKVVPNLGGCDGNCPPVAESLTLKVQMDTGISLTLSASDYDGSVASWEIVTSPSIGTISGTAPNVIYTPNLGLTGTDTFSYIATDNNGAVSNIAVVTLQVRDCNLIDIFGVPSAFPDVVTSYDYVHVSEDGPSLDNMGSPVHRVQWQNPGLHQFSLEFSTDPYYLDLNQCISSQTFSDSNAAFTLSGCGVSGLDGEYWVTQKDGNEVWVEKNNGWAIVFSNDSSAPEFCRSDGPTAPTSPPPTRKPTSTTASPTSMISPTKKPTFVPTPNYATLSPTAAITPMPTSKPSTNTTPPPTPKPTPKPTTVVTPSPTAKPVTSGVACCADRNTGYQQCNTNSWCNENESQCSNCGGLFTEDVPLTRTGCCSWGGSDCSGWNPDDNKGCQYLQSDCEGSCGGTWQFFQN